MNRLTAAAGLHLKIGRELRYRGEHRAETGDDVQFLKKSSQLVQFASLSSLSSSKGNISFLAISRVSEKRNFCSRKKFPSQKC